MILSYRAKDLLGLLQDGHLGPVVPLEHFDPRRVVHRGRRVRPEERGEALSEIKASFLPLLSILKQLQERKTPAGKHSANQIFSAQLLTSSCALAVYPSCPDFGGAIKLTRI